ncbi:FHA domain-containing protein [Clostridium sp. PL3]|uniref:FHA domain-containing protein n=1 Tax=Clostridium thailandense TaxID=2794346 RepID=A0A949TZ59_9CLOT|nr:FHA domain-containing protein [Clostridium thailandense]MBV7275333.1 FHA domain-containing protein [Clostridium thailandense]
MQRIPDYLNIVKNIKKYVMLKKLEQYSESTERDISIIAIDTLIALSVIAAACYIYFINHNRILKISISIVILLGVIFYIIKISLYVRSNGKREPGITTLILIDGKGSYSTEWEIQGKKSLLIGKNTRNSEVDIDLSNTEYSTLVSKQHAILNFAANNWFIEDIGSCNGVGIKKMDEVSKKKIEKDIPYKLDSGDIIYIANTKIFVK